MAPTTPFFVVFLTTTGHLCVQTMSWLIFKPVILAHFLTGGNTLLSITVFSDFYENNEFFFYDAMRHNSADI
jgi:hypothetical protein